MKNKQKKSWLWNRGNKLSLPEVTDQPLIMGQLDTMYFLTGCGVTYRVPPRKYFCQNAEYKSNRSLYIISGLQGVREIKLNGTTHWKRLWYWEGSGAGGEGDDRGWDGWMASLTRWTWVCVNSGSWWWTGRPGVLQFMGSQRVRHDWLTELTDKEVMWVIL